MRNLRNNHMWMVIFLAGICACQTKMADNTNEIHEMATLRLNDSLQQDSIRRLSERVSRLEQTTSTATAANNQGGKLKSPVKSTAATTPGITSPVKSFALEDTMRVSNVAVLLPNTCRWYLKSVEESKDTSPRGHRECNFHDAENIVYLNEREISLEEMKRTRDYEFDAGSKVRTYCPNITLILECR